MRSMATLLPFIESPEGASTGADLTDDILEVVWQATREPLKYTDFVGKRPLV